MIVRQAHAKSVLSIAFDPEGQRLAAAGADRCVTVWNMSHEVPELKFNRKVESQVVFSPDGKSLITNDELRIHIWDSANATRRASLSPVGHQPVFAITADRSLIAVYSNTDFLSNELEFFHTHNWSRKDTWENLSPTGGFALAFSPDGTCLALPSYREMTVWDVHGRALVGTAELPESGSPSIAYSPNGEILVAARGKKICVWETDRITLVAELLQPRGKFTGIAFHPSGRYLAATSNDATVRLYDTDTWTVAKTFTWNVGKLRSVAFSPDGTLAAVGSDSGKIVVWDVDV